MLGGKSAAALAGRAFTARVVMKPYVANESAVLRVYRGKKKLQVKSLKFKPVAGGTAGVATFKVSSKVAGQLTLKASHRATAGLATAVAKPVRVTVVRAYAGPGSSGPGGQAAAGQARRAALRRAAHAASTTPGTGRAIMAWRKVAGYSRTYVATADVFAGLLKGRGVFKVRHPGDGRHVEARLNQQVLALINGGKVERIYHTSSGKRRPRRRSRASSRSTPRRRAPTPRAWSTRTTSSAATPSTATPTCPPYNASHGCLRVPVPNARSIYDWLRIGDVVWVEP